MIKEAGLRDFPGWGDVVDEIDISIKSYISTFERGRRAFNSLINLFYCPVFSDNAISSCDFLNIEGGIQE